MYLLCWLAFTVYTVKALSTPFSRPACVAAGRVIKPRYSTRRFRLSATQAIQGLLSRRFTNHVSEIDVGDCFHVYSTKRVKTVLILIVVILILGLKSEDFITLRQFIAFGARNKFWREQFLWGDLWPLCERSIFGILGSKDGAVVRALASHQCGLGSIPAQCHMWVAFVVGSRLAPRVFLHVLRFSSHHKNQDSKFQLDQDRGPACKPAKADVASSLINVTLFVYKSLKACPNCSRDRC